MAKRTQKQPLTPEQAQLLKDVKRINERINEIAKRFGTDSYAYNQYYAMIKSTFPEKFRRFDKDARIKISRSSAFLATAGEEKTQQAITRALAQKTVGQLRKEARISLKGEGVKKPSTESIVTRMKAIDDVQKFVESHTDMFYIANENSQDIIHIMGRKKTYSELTELIQIYEDARSAGKLKLVGKVEKLSDFDEVE